MEKAPENLSIPAPSRGAAEGTTVPRDLIAKGQRGFSVETSKLEAIYFQPGFGGDLCQHLRCLAWGAPAPPIPDSKPVTGKGTPGVSLQILPSYWRGQSCPEGSLPWREGVSVRGMQWVATTCTWLMRGRRLREPRRLPRGPGSPGPAHLGRNECFWPFLPILYHYNCHLKKIQ